MRKAWHKMNSALLATIFLAAWGCDEGRPSVDSTTAEGKVSGTVTVRGKPMAGGEITFDPSNIERSNAAKRTATIGRDGTYSITTLQGRNAVRLSGPVIKKEPQLGYGIHTTDVQAGDNTFNIDLPPK